MISWKKNENTTEDYDNDFKESALDLLLKDENITQIELAEALCVNPKTLRNYLKDPDNIPLSICDKLCNLFNREFNELFSINKCNVKEVNQSLFIDESIHQKITELKNIRTSYIDAFDFFADIKNNGFELTKKTILDQIHKPLITMIGTKESDIYNFYSILLQENNFPVELPVYYVEKDDLPEIMQISETLVIKTKKEEPFDIFLLHNESYRNKIEFETFDSQKKYTEEYIIVKISEAKILTNCIILILPNLIFEDIQRKTQLQTKVKKLANITIYYLIKFISASDIILYFETSFKFFSAERTQLISYLIDNSRMSYGQSQILFIETKCKSKEENTNEGIPAVKSPLQAYSDILSIISNTSNKKQFYDGVFSYKYYDNTKIPDSEILNCIKHLSLDFDNIAEIKKRLDYEIHLFIQNTSVSPFYSKEKIEIKQCLQNIASGCELQDDDTNSIKQEQLDILNNDLKELADINSLIDILPNDINNKSEMLINIQTLTKNLYQDSQNYGNRRLSIQLVINNILIPYFLLEMTFSGGDKKIWAKKIQEEISKFKSTQYYSKIEALLSSGGIYE